MIELKSKEWSGITNEIFKLIKTYFRKFLSPDFADVNVDATVNSAPNRVKLVFTVILTPIIVKKPDEVIGEDEAVKAMIKHMVDKPVNPVILAKMVKDVFEYQQKALSFVLDKLDL